MLPEIINTERLVLRPWSFEDVPDVMSYAPDEEWARYLPVPHPYSEADAHRFIASQMLLDREQHPTWAIRHDGRTVGGINIRFLLDFRVGEIGYSIARPLWGRGLATEASQAIVTAAFSAYPHLMRIRAMADARNARSHRVLEKLGMAREGLLGKNRFVRDEFVDEVWYGVLRSEWVR
jgi:ribosomal-protein-alanine N-acetyltransferase